MTWPMPDDDPNRWNDQQFRQRSTRDARLACLIVEELVADTRISSQPIGVEVQNGVVVLTGTVDTSTTRDLIACTARDVNGVADVCNVLQVPHLAGRRQPDRRLLTWRTRSFSRSWLGWMRRVGR